MEAFGKLCQQILNMAFKFCVDLTYPRFTESVRWQILLFLLTTTWTLQQTQPQPVGCSRPRGARHTSPSLPTAPHPRRYFRVRGRSGRQHRQLIGQLLKLTGHEANENAVPGRGRVTCLRKRSLPEENEVKAGNSGSRNAGSHASGDCESVGTELTHGDSAHNCIP